MSRLSRCKPDARFCDAQARAKRDADGKALFFSAEWCNRIAVHVDSRLHLRRRHLIPGGLHGEEEKEGSEEDQAEEKEVGVRRLKSPT